ncbi:MAG: DNA mismatch repair endonuclease MutL [Planctomycetota bacterium]
MPTEQKNRSIADHQPESMSYPGTRPPTFDPPSAAGRRIRQLPATVINKIAAGEVLERPGSAVKEMLENSIDAGARSITVEVAEGGRDLIRVVDDGCGISREDLVLAVQAHATSKLESEADLFRIRTLGFRGEALSSIAGVSDFRLQSRPAEQEVGAVLEVNHGELGPLLDCGSPKGTQIEVRNLFASVPVRRKFLKSKQTELGHISEAMTRLALAYPTIALELIHNGRTVLQRPGGLSLEETIGHLFGKEVRQGLLPVHSEGEGIRLHGFVCDPSVNRPNSTMQYLFVNGRFIRDRSLGHALTEAYRGLIMTGRYPVAFLFLDMPVDEVDVNVHPTKVEVRFQDPHQIYSQILSTIRSRFLGSDLTARFKVEQADVTGGRRGSELTEAAKGGRPDVPESSHLSAEMAARRASQEAVRQEFSLNRTQPAATQGSLFANRGVETRPVPSHGSMPMPSEHRVPATPSKPGWEPSPEVSPKFTSEASGLMPAIAEHAPSPATRKAFLAQVERINTRLANKRHAQVAARRTFATTSTPDSQFVPRGGNRGGNAPRRSACIA